MQKIAVVLFNLGGPDSPEAIRPFLRNLFSDRRIIDLPAPLRHLVAWLISTRRAPKVKPLYALMGGASPILPNTQAQARAVEEALNHPSAPPGANPTQNHYKTFIAMRYWHPFASETIEAIKAYEADQIILLPLYPQFSTTTTESSLEEWNRLAAGLNIPTRIICCYPSAAPFIHAEVQLLKPLLDKALHDHPGNPPLVIFSAHGLPRKIIDNKGDPYAWQVEQTATAIAQACGLVRDTTIKEAKTPTYKVTYQSRVGPVEWLKPYTDETISEAGAAKRPIVIAPIAFVSEHIETLVELDIENRHLAEDSGCPGYYRVPTVSTHPDFIGALAEEVRNALNNECKKYCPEGFTACPCTRSRSVP